MGCNVMSVFRGDHGSDHAVLIAAPYSVLANPLVSYLASMKYYNYVYYDIEYIKHSKIPAVFIHTLNNLLAW
jgi:hypothetical protein